MTVKSHSQPSFTISSIVLVRRVNVEAGFPLLLPLLARRVLIWARLLLLLVMAGELLLCPHHHSDEHLPEGPVSGGQPPQPVGDLAPLPGLLVRPLLGFHPRGWLPVLLGHDVSGR